MINVANYTEQGGARTVIEGELAIVDEGKLTFDGIELKPSLLQEDSTASTIAGLVLDFNGLLEKLKTAGLMKTE